MATPSVKLQEGSITKTFYSMDDLVEDNYPKDCPVPEKWVSDIPNLMGINLCSVMGFEVIKIGTQIVSITIQFIPAIGNE